jgi:hypothetical protein
VVLKHPEIRVNIVKTVPIKRKTTKKVEKIGEEPKNIPMEGFRRTNDKMNV